MTGLFDPGLQPERTALAWRRTALSVMVGALVALRMLPSAFPQPAWYLPGVVGMLFAAWLWRVSHLRYRAFERLVPGSQPRLPGGGALVALAVCATATGTVALVAVLVSARG